MSSPESDPNATAFVQRMARQPRSPDNPIPECLLTLEARAAWVRQNPIATESRETREFKLQRSMEILGNTLARLERMGKIPKVGAEA